MTTVAVSGGPPGAASAGLSRAGNSALTGIADPPSPSKPGSMEDAIKLWLKIGNIEKLQARVEEIVFNLILMEANYLQQAVLDGYGWYLKDQSSRLSNVNKFLRKVPEFLEKIDTIHEMVIRGDINRLKALMDRRGWAQGRKVFLFSSLSFTALSLRCSSIISSDRKLKVDERILPWRDS